MIVVMILFIRMVMAEHDLVVALDLRS
jgi:hypothetical protein